MINEGKKEQVHPPLHQVKRDGERVRSHFASQRLRVRKLSQAKTASVTDSSSRKEAWMRDLVGWSDGWSRPRRGDNLIHIPVDLCCEFLSRQRGYVCGSAADVHQAAQKHKLSSLYSR